MLKYRVTSVTASKVTMNFLKNTVPESIRGKYTQQAEYICKTEGHTALSDCSPEYCVITNTLFVPGRITDYDEHDVYVPTGCWAGISKLLDKLGAVLVASCPVPIDIAEHFKMPAPYNKHPDAEQVGIKP